MKASPNTSDSIKNSIRVCLSAIFAAVIQVSSAADDKQPLPQPNQSGAQVECTTPDGQVVALPSAAQGTTNEQRAAGLMDDETLRYPLQEGRTSFVIKLPAGGMLDRFTFVNENIAAAGELKIYVSNDRLPAFSEQWVAVDGKVAISKKRLFNLSLLGVEARYVKLAFSVEKTVRIASAGL